MIVYDIMLCVIIVSIIVSIMKPGVLGAFSCAAYLTGCS